MIFLKATEAGRILGVCRQTIVSYAENGVIPAVKIGRQWRFKRDDIEGYITANSNKASIRNRD